MNAVEVHQKPSTAVAPSETSTIASLLEMAIEKGIPVESLERLQLMYERAADRAAAQEFNAAMAAFQAECPPIAKTSVANIASQRTGKSHTYRYAELDEIAKTVIPLLTKHGLSYTWDSKAANGVLDCVCIIRHVNGHSVTASFTCPVDSGAVMSKQQQHAAALTYAKRQSLVQALGLTTTDPDTDGAGDSAEAITEDQQTELADLLQQSKADMRKFLSWLGVEKLSEIPARDYTRAKEALARKRGKA